MSGCGNPSCGCASGCNCGSSCKCGKRSIEDVLLRESAMDQTSLFPISASASGDCNYEAEEGDPSCKCTKCNCSPCNCNKG